MKLAILFSAIFILATTAACTRTPTVSAESAARISLDARSLLAKRCPDKSSSSTTVSVDQWPQSLRALDPESVRIQPDGLYIETSRFFVEERGVFVPCNAAAFKPERGSDPSYELVTNDVYTYYNAG